MVSVATQRVVAQSQMRLVFLFLIVKYFFSTQFIVFFLSNQTNKFLSYNLQLLSTMMSSSKGKRPLRHLTAADKIEAIQRIHDGESKASVARDIGVPESTLRGWCKNEEKLRYMARQSGGGGGSSSLDCKMSIEKLTEQMADDAAMAASAAASSMFGPPEKRQKLDTSMPSMSSYSMGNNKYGDDVYKSRSSMGAMDFGGDKGLTAMAFNGLAAEYTAAYKQVSQDMMNGHSAAKAKENMMKSYGNGTDLNKSSSNEHNIKTEMSMAAISPLTSLSHLSGMPSIAQSMKYNELATNLSLLYSNPSALSSMAAGLASFGQASGHSANNGNHSSSSRASRQKSQASPRSEMDKAQSLTVKNLAKLQQKSSSSSDMDMKKTVAAASSTVPPIDETLMYWLRSQQALAGFSSLYSSNATTAASPHRSSPHQLQQQLQQLQQQSNNLLPTNTPPLNAQTPSTTPSGMSSEDTKNTAWLYQWIRSYGNFAQNEKLNAINNNIANSSVQPATSSSSVKPAAYENILYSQLTKQSRNSPSPRRTTNNPSSGLLTTTTTTSPDQLNNNVAEQNNNKPEDLSTAAAHPVSSRPTATSSPGHSLSPNHYTEQTIKVESPAASPIANTSSTTPPPQSVSPPDVKPRSLTPSNLSAKALHARSVLDNILSHSHQNMNNNTFSTYNNNTADSPAGNNGGDTDSLNSDASSTPGEAVEHGEKFLRWLESCSDPSITAMQVMQFRTLLNSIKTSADRAGLSAATTSAAAAAASMLLADERPRSRRRK